MMACHHYAMICNDAMIPWCSVESALLPECHKFHWSPIRVPPIHLHTYRKCYRRSSPCRHPATRSTCIRRTRRCRLPQTCPPAREEMRWGNAPSSQRAGHRRRPCRGRRSNPRGSLRGRRGTWGRGTLSKHALHECVHTMHKRRTEERQRRQ